MKIQYKISVIMSVFALIIVGSTSILYSFLSNNQIIKSEKKILLGYAVDSAKKIEIELLNKISITKTMATSTLMFENLQDSNNEYEHLDEGGQRQKLKELNQKWLGAANANDPFIVSYMNNPLAIYLKEQQKILPGLYGEIFVTNRYGQMIATTGKLSTLAHPHKYWWKEGFDNGEGKTFIDDRGFDESVKGYVIGIVYPIKKNNKIIGVLKANINILEALNGIVNQYNSFNHGSLKITRTNGLIVLEKDTIPLSTNINSHIVTHLKEKITSEDEIHELSNDRLIAFAPVRLTVDHPGIKFGGKKKSALDHKKGNEGEIWHTVISYDKHEALEPSRKINNMLLLLAFIITIIAIIMAFFAARWISWPIIKLSLLARKVANGSIKLRSHIDSKDEVGNLAQSFNYMLDELSKTMASRDELRQEVKKRIEAQEDLKKKDELIISQSRHAAMGEMIVMIAHQWRQPLQIINMGVNNTLADIDLGNMKIEDLQANSKEILTQTEHLTKTIDDFKNYFSPQQTKEIACIEDIIEESKAIIEPSLFNSSITLNTFYKSDIRTSIYKRELVQVLLNLINNSKEAINNNAIENGHIDIDVSQKENSIVLKVCDNGGGILNGNIDKIFDPYFTTKVVSSGTGLGLYISKTIIEKHLNGTIQAYNINKGVCFEILMPTHLTCLLR